MINLKNIRITPEMLNIITEVDEFKGSWNASEQQPDKYKHLKKIATIESIGSSNRIEGNTLTDKQVETVLANLKKQSFTTRDEQEVAGYAKLMEDIFENYEIIPFNEYYIKQLHKILLSYSDKDERHPIADITDHMVKIPCGGHIENMPVNAGDRFLCHIDRGAVIIFDGSLIIGRTCSHIINAPDVVKITFMYGGNRIYLLNKFHWITDF